MNNSKSKEEIDLVEVVMKLWTGRRVVYKSIIAFVVIGLFVAFGSKVEYEASCKLLPDVQDAKIPGLGGLGGLAGLAGINLDMGGAGALSPNLYPQIVNSLPFQIEVIHQKLTFESRDTVISSYDYFKEIDAPSVLGFLKSYTIGLPGKLRNLFSEADTNRDKAFVSNGVVIRLGQEDTELLEKFKSRIFVEVDTKTGIITLTTEMPDAVAAAELTEKCVSTLHEHIVRYKVNKAQESLNYIKERHYEAKNKFERAQENLAKFSDQNRNIVTSKGQTEHQRLQNEFNLAFEIYKSLSTQLEQAEMKVKEDTPIITVLDPAVVPIFKSKPKRVIILILAVLVGALTGVSIILFKPTFETFKQHFSFF